MASWGPDPELLSLLSKLTHDPDAGKTTPPPTGFAPKFSASPCGVDGLDGTTAKTSRERQKLEMEALRRLAADMEAQLEMLQHSYEQRWPNHQQQLQPTEIDALTAWKTMAQRQLQARKRAELANWELRKLLEEQCELVRQLATVLARAEHTQQLVCGQTVAL